ncbi:MAG: ATP-binding protein, partial [Chitinivibrionales bacterium]|nr:ATP-binding protein [Chitinivibrionales bacterium]
NANLLLEQRVLQRTATLDQTNLLLQKEIAIREKAQSYARTLIEVSLDPLVTINLEGKITDVNRATELAVGLPRDQLIGSDFSSYFTDPDKAGRAYRQVLQDGLLRDYSLSIRHVSGRTIDVLYNATVFKNENDEIQGVFAAARDVTESKRTAEELARRQQVLESIYAIETAFAENLEATFDQIVVTIAHILEVPFAAIGQVEKNRYALFSQFADGRFKHQCPWPFSHHPGGIVLREKANCQFSGDLAARFPAEFGDNRFPYKSFLGVPMLNKNGDMLGMVYIMDVRERNYTNYEMQVIEIFCRYVVHEIDRLVMERQLASSREMNLLGRIASGVAHEVRNPLNAILAINEALFQDMGQNPEYLPYLAHIRNQVNRLSALMRDLLDLGKPLHESEFLVQPLGAIIASAKDSWQHSAKCSAHRIQVSGDLAPERYFIKAHSVKIQQVIIKLLENACEHSPAGSPVVIEIAPWSVLQVSIKIKDLGTGIDPDLLGKVFEPFYTTRKGGTGLGLSIVKNIVEIHGGTIAIFNNQPYSPGLTAEIVLPLADKPADA